MAKILNVNDMLEAASLLQSEGLGNADQLRPIIAALEGSATSLALWLCQTTGAGLAESATDQPGFGGLCAGFETGPNGEAPDVIGERDPS